MLSGDEILADVEAFAMGCWVQTPTRERMVADAVIVLTLPLDEQLDKIVWEVWPGIGWAMQFTYGSVWHSDDGRMPGATWWLDAIWRRESARASVRRRAHAEVGKTRSPFHEIAGLRDIVMCGRTEPADAAEYRYSVAGQTVPFIRVDPA